MRTKGPGTLPLADLGAALLRHGLLTCHGSIETDGDGDVTVEFTVPWAQDPPDVHELYEALRLAAGVAQVRAFAAHYGIDTAALEAFLPPPGMTHRDEDWRCYAKLTALMQRGTDDPNKALGEAYDMLRQHYRDV